ncbi:hypothetical protein ACKKBF_B38190 [Auxenochlorella protothecoides x Auxenochlorella symbiontica]
MGLGVSLPSPASLPDVDISQVAFPLTLTSTATQVHELGRLDLCGVWHVVGNHKVFPFPIGYRAIHSAYGISCSLSIELGMSGRPVFLVEVEGEVFSGSTPTAPFAKWALARGHVDVVSGLMAFGLLDPFLQAVLRAAAGLRGPPPGLSPLGPVPSIAPSLANWLPFSARSGAAMGTRQLSEDLMRGNPFADKARTPLWVDTRPAIVAEARPLASMPAPETTNRGPQAWEEPASGSGVPGGGQRSRRRSLPLAVGKSGRGWTAFTAYGMEMRDAVRADNPRATATEIEKLVGQRWAQLSSEERQHYVDMAARVRKSMRASQAEEEEEAGAKRARSDTAHLADAGTERPQRTLRPPSRYTSADLVDDPAIACVGIQRLQARGVGPRLTALRGCSGMMPLRSKAPACASGTPSPRPAPDYCRVLVKRHASLDARAHQPARQRLQPAARAAPVEDHEADVLGLLAEMRAEVMASESDSPPAVLLSMADRKARPPLS